MKMMVRIRGPENWDHLLVVVHSERASEDPLFLLPPLEVWMDPSMLLLERGADLHPHRRHLLLLRRLCRHYRRRRRRLMVHALPFA